VSVRPEVIELSATLERLSLTRDQLIDMAILIGTDFNEGVKGIGPKRALSLVGEYGSLEVIVKEKRIPLLEWEEVRNIFLHPEVTDDYSMEKGTLDRGGLIQFLVEEREFGPKGVERTIDQIAQGIRTASQSSLDAFFH
jgi:flap endonuclease-1